MPCAASKATSCISTCSRFGSRWIRSRASPARISTKRATTTSTRTTCWNTSRPAGTTRRSRSSLRVRPLSSWSCLARPSTSLPPHAVCCPRKLVDGRTKSDHDGVGVSGGVTSARAWPLLVPGVLHHLRDAGAQVGEVAACDQEGVAAAEQLLHQRGGRRNGAEGLAGGDGRLLDLGNERAQLGIVHLVELAEGGG